MTANYAAQRGYQQTVRQTASEKDVELQVFASVTSKMRAANLDNPKHLTPKMAEALILNTRLWTILFSDLVSPENQLPLELKTQLIQLSEFTQAHTQKVFRGEADIDALIEINSNIMDGLKASKMKPQIASVPNNQDNLKRA